MATASADLQATCDATNEAHVVVGHTLSTLGFRGDAMRLVIEEIQFALRPAAVVLRRAGRTLSNVVEEHQRLLDERTEGHAGPGRERTAGGGCTHYPFDFDPIVADASHPPPKCLSGASWVDEFACGDTVLLVYYGGGGDEGPRPSGADNGPLLDAVRQFTTKCDEHLAKAAARVSRYDQEVMRRRLPKLASHSYYLKLVLGQLRDQILRQLRDSDPEHFRNIDKESFALQYFLLADASAGDASAGDALGDENDLRYFPLDDESEAIRSQLGPDGHDFIRNYRWKPNQSLIGYTFRAESSRYFPNWQTERVVTAGHLQSSDRVNRDQATRHMQQLRGHTDHQFNIPLFAHGQILGAIIINTRDEIGWQARRIPIRCARQVGSMIESALEMDPTVNETRKKIAAAEAKADRVRVYRHMLAALLHEEKYYNLMLSHVYAAAYESTGDPQQWRTPFLYAIKDRKQFLDEVLSTESMGSDDPIRSISPEVIYNRCNGHGYDTKVADLRSLIDDLKRVFSIGAKLQTTWRVGGTPGVSGEMATIPQFNTTVLLRIVGNLLRNVKPLMEEVAAPHIELSLDVEAEGDRRWLKIVAADNCGGFDFDNGFPRGKVDFEAWDKYLRDKEARQQSLHGMGFLTLLKYTAATGGELRVDNYDGGRGLGARVTLLLGLEAGVAEA